MRQFFSTEFDKFIKQQTNKSFKNLQIRYLYFPMLIVMFTKQFFDPALIMYISNEIGIEYNQFLIQVAFTIGSFIQPKYLIKCFILNSQAS